MWRQSRTSYLLIFGGGSWHPRMSSAIEDDLFFENEKLDPDEQISDLQIVQEQHVVHWPNA